eukprot:scaffold49853_cov47-Phaeocystis_antarctica.AAC.1
MRNGAKHKTPVAGKKLLCNNSHGSCCRAVFLPCNCQGSISLTTAAATSESDTSRATCAALNWYTRGTEQPSPHSQRTRAPHRGLPS